MATMNHSAPKSSIQSPNQQTTFTVKTSALISGKKFTPILTTQPNSSNLKRNQGNGKVTHLNAQNQYKGAQISDTRKFHSDHDDASCTLITITN
jgi:exopolysaccharide biosynthesis protein